MIALALSLLSVSSAPGRTEPKSPSDLIKYLTYQSDRPHMHGTGPASTCSSDSAKYRDDRAITKLLVGWGSLAVPAIEDALDSFEARGEESKVASKLDWLLLAYARIKGPAAFPRLRRMYNRRLSVYAADSYENDLDRSVALALGLTSYVSARVGRQALRQCALDTARSLSRTPCVAPWRQIPLLAINCNRVDEPRDALDRLILAWEQDDRVSVEASLGARAKIALDQLLEGRAWTTVRSNLLPVKAGRRVALGYQFVLTGRWAEPDGTLEEDSGSGTFEAALVNPEIETLFTNSSGVACGKVRLSFSETPITRLPRLVKYLVDNPDLADLLQVISSCAANAVPARKLP